MDADPWADAAPSNPAHSARATPEPTQSPSKSTVQPLEEPEDDGDIGLSMRSPTLSPSPSAPRASMSPSKPDFGWDDEGDIGGDGGKEEGAEEMKETEVEEAREEEEVKEEEKEEKESSEKEEEGESAEVEAQMETEMGEHTNPPPSLLPPPAATTIDPPSDDPFSGADDGFQDAAFDDGFGGSDDAFATGDDAFATGDSAFATGDDAIAAADDGFGEGDDGFGDFDDFDEPAAFDDDGFGDFGEFGEGQGEAESEAREPPPPPPPAAMSVDWTALSLRPVPPLGELLERVAAVLEPLTPDSTNFTDEPPRAVGGLAQVLATESCRDAFAQLTTAPMLKPLDWTRSRVRRDHLISMGVPVNLDEVDSHRLSTLPPLQITTSFRSKSVGPEAVARRSEADSGPASAAPALGGAESERKYGLGARPALDTARAEDLCALEEEQLALLPLAKLEALHADLAKQSADASALLAWFLQLKDAQTHDSATYNGMISELIANAAKVKGGTTSGLFRRNSGRPASLNATPRRSGSPGVF